MKTIRNPEFANLLQYEIKDYISKLEKDKGYLDTPMIHIYTPSRFDETRTVLSFRDPKNFKKKEGEEYNAAFIAARGIVDFDKKGKGNAFILYGVTKDGKACQALTEIVIEKGKLTFPFPSACIMQEDGKMQIEQQELLKLL